MIGIAMTTYNGEKYLKEQIDSILNQTVNDFELIVCDDVSSDSTMDILNGYAAKDSRVHVFRNEENLGFLKNFEKAIRICLDRGAEYVALSDQDDVWTENHLEVLVDTMSSGGGGIACGDVVLTDENGVKYDRLSEHFTGKIELLSNLDKIKISLYGRNLYQGGCMLIHKSIIPFLFPIPENIFAHDTWFFFVAAYINSFLYIPEILSQYRQHSKSSSGNQLNKVSFKKEHLRLLFKKREIPERFYHIQELLKRDFHQTTDKIYTCELRKSYSYYKYKKYFLYRLFHLGFFIRRFRYFSANKNKIYTIFKYLLWG